jgi:1-acyl-sn-glycerol-3-phosphate acyltransferase
MRLELAIDSFNLRCSLDDRAPLRPMTPPDTSSSSAVLDFHLMEGEVPAWLAARRRLLSVFHQTCLLLVIFGVMVPAVIVCLPLNFVSRRASIGLGSWALHSAMRLMIACFGWRIEVRGTPPPRGEGRGILVASNHVCYTDVMVLGSQLPMRFVGKSEISAWPFVGQIASSLGTIFLRRFDRSHILKTKQAIEQGLEQGQSIILFPEATTSDGRRVLPFHAPLLDAAREAGARVVPVAIHYAAPGETRPVHEMLAWWRPASLMTHLPRLFSVRPVIATLTWGEVIDPLELAREAAEKGANPGAVEREVRRAIAKQARESVARGLAGLTGYSESELVRRGDLPEWAPGADRANLEPED